MPTRIINFFNFNFNRSKCDMNIRTDKSGYTRLASAIRAGFEYAAAGAGNFDKRYKAQAVAVVADKLIEVLKESDATFDRDVFREACGYDGKGSYFSVKKHCWYAFGD
jgi:hypothetical protein